MEELLNVKASNPDGIKFTFVDRFVASNSTTHVICDVRYNLFKTKTDDQLLFKLSKFIPDFEPEKPGDYAMNGKCFKIEHDVMNVSFGGLLMEVKQKKIYLKFELHDRVTLLLRNLPKKS